MIYRGVRYRNKLRDYAKKHKRFLVTIDVYGKHIGDDSCCVQTSVGLAEAKSLTAQVFALLESRNVLKDRR